MVSSHLPVLADPFFVYTEKPPDTSIVVEAVVQPQILSGAMFPDYTPNFDIPRDAPKRRRSIFGPFFVIPDLCFPGEGALEYREAVGRMIALRNPGVPGYSERLARNQSKVKFRFGSMLHAFTLHLERHIVRETYDVSYPEWLFAPHAKRNLRLSVAKLVADIGRDDVDDSRDVEFKLKPGENLSAGKKRGIGDLKEWRTNATAHVMDSIKEAWKVPFVMGKTTAHFVKSSNDGELVDVFKHLFEVAPGVIHYVYHSDDSCVAAHCLDGIVRINGDIKACDGSHRTAIFDELERMLAFGENLYASAIHRAFQYLRRPLRMYNKHDRKQCVRYVFTTTRLYSGSVLTTVVNNFANLLIAMALSRRVPDASVVTKEEFLRAYILAGEDVGYMLRIDRCDTFEDVQFLKHSCSVVDGDYVPWMNLGTCLRNFGTYFGELPGSRRQPYRERAEAFVSGVVEGRKGWGNHVFNDSFAHLGGRGMTSRAYRLGNESEKSRSAGGCQTRISTESLCARYKCTVDELMSLCTYICNSDVFDIVVHPLVQRIYTKDYG